ncbi:unnamed protein product [Caenorhabditis brenneri]
MISNIIQGCLFKEPDRNQAPVDSEHVAATPGAGVKPPGKKVGVLPAGHVSVILQLSTFIFSLPFLKLTSKYQLNMNMKVQHRQWFHTLVLDRTLLDHMLNHKTVHNLYMFVEWEYKNKLCSKR